VRYDSNGQFLWKRALQGDVSSVYDRSHVLDVLIDSKDNIHFIVGFTSGTHLDNKVTVPTTITAYQYYLVKYNTAGNYLSNIPLPIADGTGFVEPSFT